MRQIPDGTSGVKNPMLASKHKVYDHFIHKEKAQVANNLEL